MNIVRISRDSRARLLALALALGSSHALAQAPNSAVLLNGIDAYGTAAGVGGLVSNSTWEAWVQIPAQPIGGGMVLTRWGMYSHALSVETLTGRTFVDMYSCWTNPCPQTSSPPNTLLRLQWHHVAMVYGPESGPSCETYVDGQLVAWCGQQGCAPYAGWETVLGAWGYTGYSNFLHATVDEARISNSRRYTAPFVPSRSFVADANTVGLWHFDEGSGSIAYDSSGNSRHFTLHGGYAWIAGNSVMPPTFTPYGTGCAGTFGIPTLGNVNGSLPQLGTTLAMRLGNLPPTAFSIAFGMVGFSNTATGGVPLPRSLSIFGMPASCTQYIDPSDGLTHVLANLGGHADWQLPIPNVPYLNGFPLHLQGAVFDLQLTNPVPVLVTNAAEAVLRN